MGKENEQETVEVTLEDMSKSFNDSKTAVLELLGEKPEEKAIEKSEEEDKEQKDASKDLDKAKKKKKADLEYEEEEDEKEEDEEEAEKSLSDSISEDAEAEAAMDVEPFLMQLVKGISEQFDTLNKSLAKLSKEVDGVRDLHKATTKMIIASHELQKATAETVEKIGDQPVNSTSVLRKSQGGKFEKADGVGDIEGMSKADILEKATQLRGEGKLTLRDVTTIEGRLNKGISLPNNLIEILTKEDK